MTRFIYPVAPACRTCKGKPCSCLASLYPCANAGETLLFGYIATVCSGQLPGMLQMGL